MKDYPYVRAWDRMMTSHSYWTEAQVALARREHAPPTACYRNSSGRWVTFNEIHSPSTRSVMLRLIAESFHAPR